MDLTYRKAPVSNYETGAFVLYSVGVNPVIFLNTLLNDDFELKPDKLPIASIVRFS
jgi:hypothetical protein